MEAKPKRYTYQTSVRWTEQRRGVAQASGKPDLQVATPPEFKGHEGVWSPEDLFVTSANVCLMSTFLALAERANLAFAGFESEAEGLLELVEGKLQFTTITLRPRLTLKPGTDPAQARALLEKAEAQCLVSNSMKSKIILEASVS